MKKNARNDFLVKSLSVFRTLLDRIEYLAGLKKADGSYQHWGFAREFGADVANRVIREAHKFNFQEFLRHPLPDLWAEVGYAASQNAETQKDYLIHLVQMKDRLLPLATSEPASLHFQYELKTLHAIARSQNASQHRAA